MKKVLVLATTPYMIRQFNKNNIILLKKMGYKVYVACNFSDNGIMPLDKAKELINWMTVNNVSYLDIKLTRSPLSFSNLKSIFKLKSFILKEHFSAIHCHTPVGGLVGRISAKLSKVKDLKIIYTAHGFHFFKNSPKINWILYYSIEKLLSYFTDVIITINDEDYNLAKRKFKKPIIFKINGVGLSLNISKKYKLGINEKKNIYLSSIGELNDNKNHIDIIKAIQSINDVNIIYNIIGDGRKRSYLEKYIIKNNLQNKVKLLGFRDDIENLLIDTDIFCFPSKREGLPLSLIEAMSKGIPCIVSNIRGNVDLISNGENGFLCNIHDINEYIDKIITLYRNKEMYEYMSKNNIIKSKKYTYDYVNNQMIKIYETTFDWR